MAGHVSVAMHAEHRSEQWTNGDGELERDRTKLGGGELGTKINITAV
jgi:hypothetical protein